VSQEAQLVNRFALVWRFSGGSILSSGLWEVQALTGWLLPESKTSPNLLPCSMFSTGI
jgi:hypothetical protein